MKPLPLFGSIARLEDAPWLAPEVNRERATVMRPQGLRDDLHGVPLGHPVHPTAVQVSIGALTSAAVLELVPELRPRTRE